ncbi:MAG: hypothetical protein ACRDIB_16995, partial [Ardenticatenaceae bacterium]
WYEAYDVARAAVPQPVQQIRPLRSNTFRVRERSLWEKIHVPFFAPARERWWVEVDGRLAALLTIERQVSRPGGQVEFLVPPLAVGVVEEVLVNQLTRRLQGQSGIRLSIAAGLSHARTLLHDAGFKELRTLDHMALDL